MTPQATARSLSLTLPGFVPDSRLSLNGRHRTHWTVIRELRTDAAWHVTANLMDHAEEPEHWGIERARVSVAFVYPIQRRRDPDGLAGLAKPLLDVLVDVGVLQDDDSEHVELAVRAVVEKGTTETRIVITELPTQPEPAGGGVA